MTRPTQSLLPFPAGPSGASPVSPALVDACIVQGEAQEEPGAFTSLHLHCGDVGDLLFAIGRSDDRWPHAFDLVIADPPWADYGGARNGAPSNHYNTLTKPVIGRILQYAVRAMNPGARLALWHCGPLVCEAITEGGEKAREFESPINWGAKLLTMGAWNKLRAGMGTGYHWRGDCEPVFIFAKDGTHHTNRSILLSNSHTSQAGEHSEKPIEWQRDWIRAWVPPQGTVFDPFMGLGSVAIATVLADEEDRKEGVLASRTYVGCEIDPTRFEVALGRVAQRPTVRLHVTHTDHPSDAEPTVRAASATPEQSTEPTSKPKRKRAKQAP